MRPLPCPCPMSELKLLAASFGSGGTKHRADAPLALSVSFEVAAPVAFDVDVAVEIHGLAGGVPWRGQLRAAGWDPSWLPRGRYRAHVLAPRLDLPDGHYEVHATLWHALAGETTKAATTKLPLAVEFGLGGERRGPRVAWQLESEPGTTPIDALSWRRGAGDWFQKHFDHAARTVAS